MPNPTAEKPAAVLNSISPLTGHQQHSKGWAFPITFQFRLQSPGSCFRPVLRQHDLPGSAAGLLSVVLNASYRTLYSISALVQGPGLVSGPRQLQIPGPTLLHLAWVSSCWWKLSWWMERRNQNYIPSSCVNGPSQCFQLCEAVIGFC